MIDSTQIWAISDGHAGNVRQASALAASVADLTGARVVAHELATRIPWRWLAPRRWPGSALAFGDDFFKALATPPRLAIGCGRQAALVTRLLRERGAQTVQILDPRIDPENWDLLITPQHDGLHGANVIYTVGSLHPVDDAWLARARGLFPAFAELPGPRTAVLLGGGSAHAKFDRAAFERLARQLDDILARDGGSLLLTTSRRTPGAICEALRHRYDDTPGIVWRGEADGANPYAGLLAWADRIVCSADSVNMISEACATRVPVFVLDPGHVRGRPRRFLETLLACGRIRAMDATLAAFDVEPLRETARVAEHVRQRLL